MDIFGTVNLAEQDKNSVLIYKVFLRIAVNVNQKFNQLFIV